LCVFVPFGGNPFFRFWSASFGLLCALGVASAESSAAPDAGPAVVATVFSQAAVCQSGQSYQPFRSIEEMVRESASEPALRNDLEAGLVKLLAPTSTFEARRFACKQLGIIGTRTALPALANLLPDEQTAGIACLALTTYPPGKADAVLRAALSSARGTARVQILNTIGDRRDEKSVLLLKRLAAGTDPSAAKAAIAALGKIGDRAAWRTISAMRHRSHSVPEAALAEASLRCAEHLANSADPTLARGIYEELLAGSEPAYIRRGAFQAVLRLDKNEGEQRILTLLRGSDAVLKPVAIAAVRSVQSKGASEEFAAELSNLAPEEQAWMIDSLAARGDAPARAAIENSLASSQPVVRAAAIAAVGRIGQGSNVAALARALAASSGPEERHAIESALVELGGGSETDQAILVELKTPSAPVRVHLIAALARRQGPGANALLLEEADDHDPAVAKAAFRALAKAGEESDALAILDKLLHLQDAEVRTEAESAAAQVLARIDDLSRRSILVREALDWAQTVESRCSLLTLLPACGDDQALSVVGAATADSEPRVREAAIRALAEWPELSAWDALAGVYLEPGNDSVRGVALRGLVRLAGEQNAHPDGKLAARYTQLLASARGDADLKLILGTLAGAANPEALQLVLPLLSNSAVRAEAEVAVKKIAAGIKVKYPQAAEEALKRIQKP
jgi:HEAT repeat protein